MTPNESHRLFDTFSSRIKKELGYYDVEPLGLFPYNGHTCIFKSGDVVVKWNEISGSLVNESQYLKLCQGPSVVKLVRYISDSHGDRIETEYVPYGGSVPLRKWVEIFNNTTKEDFVTAVGDIKSFVERLKSKGFYHLDMSLKNIVMKENVFKHPIFVDFGRVSSSLQDRDFLRIVSNKDVQSSMISWLRFCLKYIKGFDVMKVFKELWSW